MSDDNQTKPQDQSTPPADSAPKDSQASIPPQDTSSDGNAGNISPDSGDNKPTQPDSSNQTPVEDEGYELELADESPLSQEDLDEIVEEASRLNLTKPDAEKLIALKEKAYKSGAEKVKSEYQSKIEAQRKEIMADPIFQGEQAKKTFASMQRAIETFGDEGMVELVKSAEFGNNVVLARFLKRLGDALAPDTDSMTGGKGTGGKSQDGGNDSLKTLYPEFFQEQK